jgi:hypothetical protein
VDGRQNTIGTLLDNGWSLGVCCRHCPRTIEMKPEAIEERFGAYRDMPLGNLLPKLVCGEPQGCGSTDMVLFPYKEEPAKPKAKKPPEEDLLSDGRDQAGTAGSDRASFATSFRTPSSSGRCRCLTAGHSALLTQRSHSSGVLRITG